MAGDPYKPGPLTEPFIGVDYANGQDKLVGNSLSNIVIEEDLFWSSEPPPKEVKPVALKSPWNKCNVCKGPVGACKHTSSAVAMMAKNAKAKKAALKQAKLNIPLNVKVEKNTFAEMVKEVEKHIAKAMQESFAGKTLVEVASTNLEFATPEDVKKVQKQIMGGLDFVAKYGAAPGMLTLPTMSSPKAKEEAVYKAMHLGAYAKLDAEAVTKLDEKKQVDFYNLNFNADSFVKAPEPVNLGHANPASAPYGYAGNMGHIHKMQKETWEQYAKSIDIFVTSYDYEKLPVAIIYKVRETYQGAQILTSHEMVKRDIRNALLTIRDKLLSGTSAGEACGYFNAFLPVPNGYTTLKPSDLHTEHSLAWYVKALFSNCTAIIAGEPLESYQPVPMVVIDSLMSVFGKKSEDPLEHEVVELTITGLTKAEAEAMLKFVPKSKSGQPAVVSTKVRKEIGTNSKAIVSWPFESSSMAVNGEAIIYKTQLNEDGTVSCNCSGWTRGSAKNPNGRFCKHTRAIEDQFDVKTLHKKWKKGEPLGPEFVPVDGPEASLVVGQSKKAGSVHMKFKRVIEL